MVTGAPASPDVPPPGPVEPDRTIPEQWDLPPREVGRVRAALDTPIVNSIWRSLGGSGLLEPACDWLEGQAPHLGGRSSQLRRTAIERARAVPWACVTSPAALERARISDAGPGVAAVLDGYLSTLPRVLTLAACCGDG